MAMASWMQRTRILRSGRFNRKEVIEEDLVRLDLKRNASELAKEVLGALSQHRGLTDAKRLNYLNAFVKLLTHVGRDLEKLCYTIEEVLKCLRISLVLESTIIRSAALRAIRHSLTTVDQLLCFNKLLIPFLLARSLDLALKNDVERIEAMKLIRRVLLLAPAHFDVALGKSLVSLANGGIEEKDRMLRVCLAALSELGILNSEMFIGCGGVGAITRNLLECQTPKIAESLCGVLLLLLDRPATRDVAGVDLHCVAAPYCDFHYRHGWMDKNRDERELRFNCSRLALLSILRSWPGIIHFCGPNDTSGLKAIVDILYLNQLEVRKAVLDLLYELLNLPQPEWTDELSVALGAVDPAEPQAMWRLSEGFIASEGRSILPHLASTVPSIADMHLALLLYCFLETGLLHALCEVIATSDTFISVRATVLLGELLRLIQVLLPPECCNISPALPNLIESAATNKPQALRAVTALQQLHKLLKKRPASSSLYLDYILQSGNLIKRSYRVTKKYRSSYSKSRLSQLVTKDGDEEIRETRVLLDKDAYTWNWNIIKIILRDEAAFTLDLCETSHRQFLRQLVHFFQPSHSRYSHMDLTLPPRATAEFATSPQAYTIAGVELILCLLRMSDPMALKLIKELFADVAQHVDAITSSRSAHDCLFSPQHMANTQCQNYFLFIGRLGAHPAGVSILKELGLYSKLEHLSTTTHHDCYVKLAVSCFDYQHVSPARDLLAAVLQSAPHESNRLYSTQLLLVLLRSTGVVDARNLPATQTELLCWIIDLLSVQLVDKSRSVYLCALSILHEACEGSPIPCLQRLIKRRPDLVALGERGVLLLIRMASVSSGYNQLLEGDFLVNEIRRWGKYFNYRYVFMVEGDTSDALTLHQKGEDGRYDKRTSSLRPASRKELYLSPHLYGQLAKHSDGFQLLISNSDIGDLMQCLYNGRCTTDQEVLNVKAALWALSNLGSTPLGFDYLQDRCVFHTMIAIAETSPVYSLRATAYYALGLVAITKEGADHLFKLGWVCTRHDRHDRYPIIEEENWEQACRSTVDQATRAMHGDSITSPTIHTATDITTPLNSTILCSDSENTATSSDLIADFYAPDADSSSTTEDDLLIINCSGTTQFESSTLPMSQSTVSAHHKRTITESKTCEFLKPNHQQTTKQPVQRNDSNRLVLTEPTARHRDNSFTESTTSGVSSCESVLGKSILNEKVQTLSPIPSTSSLITLKNPKNRRHSESSRRISGQSMTPTDRYNVSPASSINTNKLSYQDRIGYATIRVIQRPIVFSDSSLFTECTPFQRAQSLNRNVAFLTPFVKHAMYSHYDESHYSVASLSRIQQSCLDASVTNRTGVCYMGICLPLNLSNLFPELHTGERDWSYIAKAASKVSQLSSENSSINEALPQKTRSTWHDTSTCMNCTFSARDNKRDTVRTVRASTAKDNQSSPETATSPPSNINEIAPKILKIIEQLGNPILLKATRQSLLHLKQQYPDSFRDLCLYSDVCAMLNENAFRLIARKFVHELFMDVDFSVFSASIAATETFAGVRAVRENQDDTHDLNGGGKGATTYAEQAALERKLEMAAYEASTNKVAATKPKTVKRNRPITGFKLQEQANTSTTAAIIHTPSPTGKILSPTTPTLIPSSFFEARSPPLSSVRELEEVVSTENLLDSSRRDERPTSLPPFNTMPTKTANKSSTTTLDSLGLTCTENKFPYRRDC